MTALNAPYAHGTLVTVGNPEDCCPTCRSADLRYVGVATADSGLYECVKAHAVGRKRLTVARRYDDVTPVDPGTGHAHGYPRAAEQTPPKCPVEWCVSTDKRHNLGSHHIHTSRYFGPDGTPGRPWIVQEWTAEEDWEPAALTMPAETGIVDLNANAVRAFALMVDRFHPGSPLAAALRQAADELDRITSSTSTGGQS